MKTALNVTAMALLAAGSLAVGTAASAAVFTSGSFDFTASTSSTTNVTTTTTFPLTSPVNVGNAFDDFTLFSLPATLTLPAGAVNFNLVGCCNWTDPQLGSFVGTVAPVQTQTTSTSATWEVEGLLTLGSGWDNASAVMPASMTWNFVQPASTAATTVSGNFQAGASAPEPTTLALLGLGLAGLAVTRRRKQ